MSRRPASNELRRAAVARHSKDHPLIEGRQVMYCATCDAQIDLKISWWELDHRIPLALGGSNEPDNLQVLCGHCHKQKTRTKDIPIIAKVTRTREKQQGVRRTSKPMPFGKRSPLKRKLNGEVVPRA